MEGGREEVGGTTKKATSGNKKKRTKKGKESSVDSENVDGVVVARDGL